MRENLSEQIKILELQNEKLTEAKVAFERDKAEVADQLERVNSDIHLAKYVFRDDEMNQSRDNFSLKSKPGLELPAISPKPALKRKLSESQASLSKHQASRSNLQSGKKGSGVYTIKFDGSGAQAGPASDAEQLKRQINTYEMNDDARAFLESYLKEDKDRQPAPERTASMATKPSLGSPVQATLPQTQPS